MPAKATAETSVAPMTAVLSTVDSARKRRNVQVKRMVDKVPLDEMRVGQRKFRTMEWVDGLMGDPWITNAFVCRTFSRLTRSIRGALRFCANRRYVSRLAGVVAHDRAGEPATSAHADCCVATTARIDSGGNPVTRVQDAKRAGGLDEKTGRLAWLLLFVELPSRPTSMRPSVDVGLDHRDHRQGRPP